MAKKTRSPRRTPPRSGAPRTPEAGLRIDSRDEVLRVLSDFDFDPSRTSRDDVERRIAAATRGGDPLSDPGGPAPRPSAGTPAQGHEVYISNILAELMDDGMDEDGASADSARRPRPLAVALAVRRLEVGLARGKQYLASTDDLLRRPGWGSEMARRIDQGRALIAYLERIPSPSTQEAGGLPADEAAILPLCRRIGVELTDLLPASRDLEAPSLPLGRLAEGIPIVPEGTADKGIEALRDTYADVLGDVALRRKLVEAARSAWALGTELLGHVGRLEVGAAA